MKRISFTCETCGTYVENKLTSPTARFCSVACYRVAPPVKRGVTLRCEHCDTPFYALPGMADAARYCSRRCTGLARKALNMAPCPICSTAFHRRNKRQICCSKSCARALQLAGYDPRSAAVARFWSKVDKRPAGGCWLWTGAVSGDGYGALWDGVRQVGAHRYSYELHNGPLPDGLWALHRCDTPLCVRPTHLYAGDQVQNQRDRWARTGFRRDEAA